MSASFDLRVRIPAWLAAMPLVSLGCGVCQSGGSGGGIDASTWVVVAPPEAGLRDGATCAQICGAGDLHPFDPDFDYCDAMAPIDGSLAASCTHVSGSATCSGRRPNGFRQSSKRPTGAPIARYFADLAVHEWASVHAFEYLAAELVEWKAPDALVVAARKAATDERRHTAMTMALARRFGAGHVRPPKIARRKPRSLEAFAVENAVEGCVRETFGAMAAAWQAVNARDARVRRAMASIAEDEAGHAQLAWEIDDWVVTQLEQGAIGRVHAARTRAITQLSQELQATPHAALVHEAGVLAKEQALTALGVLRSQLWDAAA